MNPRLRPYKKPALIGAATLVLALAFAWLALPGIIQWQAEKFIAEKTGHRLSLARPEINPLDLSVRLRDLRLVAPGGAQLLGFKELLVDLSAASLSQGAWVFDEIRLDGLSTSVIQLKQGGLNWSALLDALKSQEARPESGGLPQLAIRHLRISGAQAQVTDQRVAPAFATRIEPLDLELTDVSTLPDAAGRFKLNATTLSGAKLSWQGELTLNPLASTGHIDVADIGLERLAPLLQDQLPIAPPSGTVAFGADYRLARAGDALSLSLAKISLSAAALRLQKAQGATPPLLAVERLEIKDGRFDLGTRQLALGEILLQDSRVEAVVGSKDRAPVLKLDGIALSDVKVDLAARNATLAAASFRGGAIGVRRDAQGRIDLLEVIDSLGDKAAPNAVAAAKAPVSTPASPAAAAAPWRFRIEHVALNGFGLVARDETVAPAAEFAFDNISMAVDGVGENLKEALPLKASLDVRSGGRLELAGKLTPADAAADLQLKVSDLALGIAQPYLSKFAALDLAGGQVSAAGRLTRNDKGSAYRGDFAVHDLRLNAAGTKNPFIAWKSLSSKDIELGPHQLNVALLSLDGLDTSLIIAKDKSTNLMGVLRKDAAGAGPRREAGQGAPAAAEPTPKTAAPGFLVNVDRLRFRNGALDFADNSLLFPFATQVHGLRGSIVGLSSRPGVPSQLELDGEVDEFGLARAVGQVDFFKPTDFMDIKVVFRNVEMARMTPYSATFAGRKIDSGKLSLELEYKIKQRQLLGENRIVIDRLVLGERVESPKAVDLPLDLAVALLSDADGRIDLGLPISGSLDDPQFSYGQVVWKAITNMLGQIVTAPFRALAALFGGSSEKIDKIAFEAGARSLTPPEREKLVRLATALNKRPGLVLTVHGSWAEVDRDALQDLQLRRAVADRSGQAVGAKGDPGPLSTRTPKVQAALESLFAERFGSADLAALKGVDFYAVLFQRLLASEAVKDGALQELATTRAEYALETLKAAGAPPARIRIGTAEKGVPENREVLLKLELGKAGG